MSSASSSPVIDAAPAGATSATGAEHRYRPLCLLGHGGMGSVEAVAEDLDDGSTRVVALKRILRTPGTDASRLEMFLREARLTTLLSHPNVIRSLAYGESLGEVFLAMEYIAGEPLSRVIAVARERHEPLPLPVLIFILAEACEGLHAAHELKGPDGESLGVVHRDVSPHNVMVGYDGSVKLLDFGVAKIDLIDCAARTKTGEVKGKTAYMSPEQAMGEVVDRRSDLYSVGAVLFECVTGGRMWGKGTDFDVLRKLALEQPPSLEAAAPDAPSSLATLYARLVERSRDKRPATAADVARELRAHAGSADASAVRDAMTRLFEQERKQREATIEQALQGGSSPSSPPDAPARRSAAGESGPVFVTHRTPVPPAGRGTTRIAASVAAGLALVAGVGAFALLRGPSQAVIEASTAATRPPASTASAAPASPSLPPSALVTPPPQEVEEVTVANATAPPPRHVASPHVLPSLIPGQPRVHRAGAIPPRANAAPSSASPAPTAAPTKAPEPPDVDPTPF